MEIEEIDLLKCSPYKDFGRGFYTTAFEEQAKTFASRKTELEGGAPTITIYEVPDDLLQKPELNVRVFEDIPSTEWAVFVTNNRNRNFKDYANPECNLDNKYDIVVGPVANDNVGYTIRNFFRGDRDLGYLLRQFDYGKLTNQITFHTEKALSYMKKVGVLYD
ncbi:MAG: DUF3990 domain-containing protein [Clostridia bacterium]|nr:DUF3990 domain-containing protein [Clostridia bacterium]